MVATQPILPAWQRDKKWSDKFLPELKRICGEYLIGEAPYEEDARRNTDLVVLRLEAVRVACRIRKAQYFERYADEFTIRTERPSGQETELGKVIAGWGDYILYAFARPDDDKLAAWCLGDLNIFRLWFMREMARRKGEFPGLKQANKDGSSTFLAFRISDLPEAFVIARKC